MVLVCDAESAERVSGAVCHIPRRPFSAGLSVCLLDAGCMLAVWVVVVVVTKLECAVPPTWLRTGCCISVDVDGWA